MAETSLREGAREVTQHARPSEINPKLEEAVQNQPLLPHLLSFRPVVWGLVAGAVAALLLLLLFSPMMAGFGLIVAFFATWIGLSVLSYQRAETARSERDESDDESDDD